MSKVVESNKRRRRQRKTVLSKKKLNVQKTFDASFIDDELDNLNAAQVSSKTTKQKVSQLSDALKSEIVNSPDAVVEIIYPLLGKILKKYLYAKYNTIKSSLNLKRISTKINGENRSGGAIDLAQVVHPQIEKVIVIEQQSGVILSEFSNTLEISDVTSKKMLTSILQLVNSNQNNSNSIKHIEYDQYTIHIQFVSNYFMAVIISGPYNWSHRDVLEDKILNFAQRELIVSDFKDKEQLTKKLIKVFRKKELIVQ